MLGHCCRRHLEHRGKVANAELTRVAEKREDLQPGLTGQQREVLGRTSQPAPVAGENLLELDQLGHRTIGSHTVDSNGTH